MPKDLYQISPGAPEYVKVARVRVSAERLLNLQRKAIHATPHISPAHRQPYPHARRKRDHRRSNTSNIVRSTEALMLPPIRTR